MWGENTLDKIKRRLDLVKQNINEFEGIAIEAIQRKQRHKREWGEMNRVSVNWPVGQL